MRTVSCDHCGLTKPVPGISRLDNWSSVRTTRRERDPRFEHRSRTTDALQYELCPDCTTEIDCFLSKSHAAEEAQ
jgi:hypothetical protein